MVQDLNRVAKRLVNVLDLPADAILDLPRITITGNLEILIEKHKGIEKYTTEEVWLRMKDGLICISGRKLAIRMIARDDIKLEGIIEKIEFQHR